MSYIDCNVSVDLNLTIEAVQGAKLVMLAVARHSLDRSKQTKFYLFCLHHANSSFNITVTDLFTYGVDNKLGIIRTM